MISQGHSTGASNRPDNGQHGFKSNAKNLVSLGFSVLALKGNKLPFTDHQGNNSWKQYQTRQPNASEIDRWFNNSEAVGLGIITGSISGNLECLDIDTKYDLTGNLWSEFKDLIIEHAPDLFGKLVIAQTVNGGYHLPFKHGGATVKGNHALAKRLTTDEERRLEKEKKGSFSKSHALIETRGQGGYFAAFPTKGYKFLQGNLQNVPTLSDDERDLLYTLAKSFDQMPPEEDYREKKVKQDFSGLSPFDDYNQRADVVDLLGKHGWKVVSSRGNIVSLKRPGVTDSKQSASLFKDSKIFYVFSTSTEFDSEKGYTPSRVYTILEHNGDFSAASKQLYADGFGDRRAEKSQSSTQEKGESKTEGQSELTPLRALRMSDVQAEKINWLWEPFLARGTFNLLEGEEGIGKTFVVCSLASAIGHGRGLPNVFGDHIAPSNVLLISAEDSLSHVLKPRLESMGAPCDKIIAIDEPFSLDKDGILRLSFALAEYEPKLVVIDPIFSYTGKINLDRDNDIRAVTDELKRLAEKYDCCIVGIRHIGKSKGFGDARNAGLNGVGWRASARSVLLIGKNPENDKQKALCQTKNNLAPKYEKSIGFQIVGGEFFWTGDSSLTSEIMLSAVRGESNEEKDEKRDAMAFLREILRNGCVSAKQVQYEARKNGVSESTLRRAKSALGVKSEKQGGTFGGDPQWVWQLPDAEDVEDVQDVIEDAQIKDDEHLQANYSNKTSYRNDLAEDAHESNFEHLQGSGEHLQENREVIEI